MVRTARMMTRLFMDYSYLRKSIFWSLVLRGEIERRTGVCSKVGQKKAPLDHAWIRMGPELCAGHV
jgi:hypothetical protein